MNKANSTASLGPLGEGKVTPSGLRYFGAAGTKGALVLIHGFMDGAPSWWPMIGNLGLSDWGVLVPHLSSVAIDAPESRNALDQFADAVIGMIEAEGAGGKGPLVIVGQSMGGQIAELVAARCGASLGGIALICPAPLKGYPLDDDMAALFNKRALDRDPQSVAAGRNRLAPNASDEAMETLVGTCLATPEDAALAQLAAWSGGHPDGEQASKAKAPLLLISSDDTFFTHEYLKENTGARFDLVTHAQIAGAGHWPHVEKPVDVAQAITAFAKDIGA